MGSCSKYRERKCHFRIKLPPSTNQRPAKKRLGSSSVRKPHSTQNLQSLRIMKQPRKNQKLKTKRRCLKTWKEKRKRKKRINIGRHNLKRTKRDLRMKEEINLVVRFLI